MHTQKASPHQIPLSTGGTEIRLQLEEGNALRGVQPIPGAGWAGTSPLGRLEVAEHWDAFPSCLEEPGFATAACDFTSCVLLKDATG